MVNETITAHLGTRHPEDNPALAGCCPPPAGRPRPLLDEQGQPLLPRIARALRKAMTRPAAARRAEAPRGEQVTLSEYYPPIDPSLLGMYLARGMQIRSQATADTLLAGVLAGWRGLAFLARTVRRWLTPAPETDVERLRILARRGALDVERDYEQRRAAFYGRGL
jgi:hypothetical protein